MMAFPYSPAAVYFSALTTNSDLLFAESVRQAIVDRQKLMSTVIETRKPIGHPTRMVFTSSPLTKSNRRESGHTSTSGHGNPAAAVPVVSRETGHQPAGSRR